MQKILTVLFFVISATANAYAFNRHNLDEAIEMAQLSAMMNGDGSAAMGTPLNMKDSGRWQLIREGKGGDAANKAYGFARYGNRWAAFQSTAQDQPKTYAIVVRGTIEDPTSIIEDALALTTQASMVWFKDNAHSGKGHLIQLAEDEKAGVHLGFAAGLVDILFHGDISNKPQGLLGFLQGLDDGSVIYITGHSQGAGIATLLHSFLLERKAPINEGYGLSKKHLKIYSYVFAQPKPGDWNFAMDFSRSLYRANDDAFAYVINNTWDWVAQAPLSVQWPSEFVGRFRDSYSGDKKQDFDELLKFVDKYWQFEQAFRGGLTTALNGVEANRNNVEEIKKKLVGSMESYAGDWMQAKVTFQSPPPLPNFVELVWRDPTRLLFNDLGDFNAELEEAYCAHLSQPEEQLHFHPASSVSYTPVGTLIALPLKARATEAPNDITLQHHMGLYLKGLEYMKQDLP